MIGWIVLAACGGNNAYILEGTVVEVKPEVAVIAHDRIEGLGMDAMTMPFSVHDAAVLQGVAPGDRVVARLIIDETGSWLERVRVTGHGAVPEVVRDPGTILRVHESLEPWDLPLSDGTTLRIGEGQRGPVVLTFAYKTCPIPEFCPATIAKLQAIQKRIGTAATIVVVTLDPANDTPEALQAWAAEVGAGPAWKFARLEHDALVKLALRAGLSWIPERGEKGIEHALRVWVLDGQGKLVERYDGLGFDVERLAGQVGA